MTTKLPADSADTSDTTNNSEVSNVSESTLPVNGVSKRI